MEQVSFISMRGAWWNKVDTQVLKTCANRRAGSSPAVPTNDKRKTMKYEIWGTQGQDGIKIAEHEDFGTCLHQCEVLKRQMSVKIKRSDGYVYSWEHKSFYRDRVIKK